VVRLPVNQVVFQMEKSCWLLVPVLLLTCHAYVLIGTSRQMQIIRVWNTLLNFMRILKIFNKVERVVCPITLLIPRFIMFLYLEVLFKCLFRVGTKNKISYLKIRIITPSRIQGTIQVKSITLCKF